MEKIDNQRNRKIDGQRQIDSYKDRKIDSQKDIYLKSQKDKQKDTHTDRQIFWVVLLPIQIYCKKIESFSVQGCNKITKIK